MFLGFEEKYEIIKSCIEMEESVTLAAMRASLAAEGRDILLGP